jgi:pimeloyl-ACP methyl ester carboxylesterase
LPKEGSPNDVPTGADDLHGLVTELGLGPVLLAGQDWGGSTAFAFAAAHPDEVRRLAVLEAMPAGPWTETGPGRSSTWFAGFHQIPDLPGHLSRPLDLPVMGVGGERVFGAAVAGNLRHGASNVRQEVLADCGHYVSEERPAELADLLLSFFDET